MSCKGLVELIVLNVGLNAGILSPRVFAMFVLEALLLTFMTTPAVVLLYPPEKRVRVSPTGANFNNVPGGDKSQAVSIAETGSGESHKKSHDPWKTRFTVVLDKVEHLPGMMALAQFMQPPPQALAKENANASSDVCVEALRLIELSDRTSAVMKSSAWDSLIYTDPLLGIFRTFGELNGMAVSTSLAIVSYDDLASSVAEVAGRNGAQLVLLPWLPPHYEATDYNATPAPTAPATPRVQASNPFESMFRTAPNPGHSASALHSHFVRSVFAQSVADVALYVDQSIPGEMPKVTTGASGTGGRWHLFLPFFGGPDDRLALEFVVQLCAHPRVSATVVRFTKADLPDLQQQSTLDKQESEAYAQQNALTVQSTSGFPDTVYGHATTQTRLQSETADNVIWQRYAAPSDAQSFDSVAGAALARVEWQEVSTPNPLRAVVDRAAALDDSTAERRSRLLIVAGRSRRLAVENHHAELKGLMEEHGGIASEVKKTVGDVAAAFIVTGSKASIVVLQAANASLD